MCWLCKRQIQDLTRLDCSLIRDQPWGYGDLAPYTQKCPLEATSLGRTLVLLLNVPSKIPPPLLGFLFLCIFLPLVAPANSQVKYTMNRATPAKTPNRRKKENEERLRVSDVDSLPFLLAILFSTTCTAVPFFLLG